MIIQNLKVRVTLMAVIGNAYGAWFLSISSNPDSLQHHLNTSYIIVQWALDTEYKHKNDSIRFIILKTKLSVSPLETIPWKHAAVILFHVSQSLVNEWDDWDDWGECDGYVFWEPICPVMVCEKSWSKNPPNLLISGSGKLKQF